MHITTNLEKKRKKLHEARHMSQLQTLMEPKEKIYTHDTAFDSGGSPVPVGVKSSSSGRVSGNSVS